MLPSTATALTTNGLVSPIWYFGDVQGTRPLNVRRVTAEYLVKGIDNVVTNYNTRPMTFTAAAYPTLTNGYLRITNLLNGYAIKVTFSDSFNDTSVTNYFGTNVTGNVNANEYLTTFIDYRAGRAINFYGPYFGTSTYTSYVSEGGSGTVQTNISYLSVTNAPWVSNYQSSVRLTNFTASAYGSAGTKAWRAIDNIGVEQAYINDEGLHLPATPLSSMDEDARLLFIGDSGYVSRATSIPYASLSGVETMATTNGATYTVLVTNAAISNTRVQLGNGTNTIVSTNFVGNGINVTNISGTNIIGTLTNNTTGNAATATTTRWTNSTSYFVDANGIDANDGKSSQRAKLTLTNAVSTAGSLGTIYASGILNTSNHVTITNAGGLVGYGATIVNKRGGLDGLIGGHHIQLSGVTITNATDPFETSSAIGSTYLSANIPFTNGIFRDVVAYGDGDVAFFKLNHPATAEFHNCSFFGKYDDFVSAGPLDFHFYGCKFSAIGPSVFGEENVTAYQSNGFATENSTNTFYGCSFVGRNSTYNYAFNGVGGRNTFNACSFFVSSTNTVFGAYETYGLSFTGGTNYLNGCVINIPFDPETSAAYAIAGGGTGRTFLNNVILDPIDLQIDNSTATMVFYVSGGNIRPENFNSPAYVIWSGYTNPKMRTNGLGTVVANITLTLTNQDGSVYEVAARRIVP